MRILTLLVVVAACKSYGPRSLPRDRFDYHSAVSTSLKEQMLLNIVKLRYLEVPVFVEVQQILAGYTLEGTGAVGWSEDGIAPGWSFGASGKYTDRPTITYRPLSGKEFTKNLMEPIPPHGVLYLIQAGYAADLILPLCLSSINGLRNASGTIAGPAAPDEGFTRFVEKMAELQRMGVMGMRIEKGKDEKTATVMFFHQRDISPEGKEAMAEIRSLLRLDPDATTFQVGYSTGPGGGNSIQMLTRSMLVIMFELATRIEVPAEDEEKGHTVPGAHRDHPLIRVRTDGSPPDDAFVRIRYRGDWFWIENGDLFSKRTFAIISLLANYTQSERAIAPPLVTVSG